MHVPVLSIAVCTCTDTLHCIVCMCRHSPSHCVHVQILHRIVCMCRLSIALCACADTLHRLVCMCRYSPFVCVHVQTLSIALCAGAGTLHRFVCVCRHSPSHCVHVQIFHALCSFVGRVIPSLVATHRTLREWTWHYLLLSSCDEMITSEFFRGQSFNQIILNNACKMLMWAFPCHTPSALQSYHFSMRAALLKWACILHIVSLSK